MSWLDGVSDRLGLTHLGRHGAAANAARSLDQPRRAAADLAVFLTRFAQPAGKSAAVSAAGTMTTLVRREATGGGDQIRVMFEVALGEHSGPLAVVGDFNGWDPTATPFTKRSGLSQATVVVDGGRRYLYRYFAADDGRWFNNQDADGYEPNRLGGDNSVLDLVGSDGSA